MTYEIDFFGDYAGENNMFSYNVGFIQCLYPDSADDLNFSEIKAKITRAFTLGYAVIANVKSINFDVFSGMYLNFHIGVSTDEFYTDEKFADYGVSLSKNSFTFRVSKTDIDDVRVTILYAIDIDL